MKKLVYLCGMLLLSMNMMAQIDLNDRNWDTVFFDTFDSNSWNTWNNWMISHPTGHYIAYLSEWLSGVSRDASEHQVYQRENCKFGNGTLQLKSVYEGGDHLQNMLCGEYDLPPGKTCDTAHHTLYYTSGNIQTTSRFRYGYFEIRCKLPVHQGAFPAFWLWYASDGDAQGNNAFYEEIDFFEYTWWLTHPDGPNPSPPSLGSPRCFTSAVVFNDNSSNWNGHIYAQTFQMVPSSSNDLSDWHTFGCEWLPDHIIWYLDGNEYNSYHNTDSIPHRELFMKVNYAIDNLFKNNNVPHPGGLMTVDYIKVCQLDWNCDTDEVITCTADLNSYSYGVKKSVAITSSVGDVNISSTDKMTFRVTDTFEITGPFQADAGSEFTVIQQLCPPD